MGRRIRASGAGIHERRSHNGAGDEGLRRGASVGGVLAVLTAAILVVTGCSGGDDPPRVPTRSPVTSQTTSASTSTATPSEVPAAARAHTPAGAVAFVRYFIEQSNEAWTRPSAGLVSPLSASTCRSCSELEAVAKELTTKGHRYQMDPVRAGVVRPLEGGLNGRQNVEAVIHQQEVDVLDGSGKTVSMDHADTYISRFALGWSHDRWLIFGIAE